MTPVEEQVTTLHVGGASPYDVLVGHHLTDRLAGVVGDRVRQVALLHDADLAGLAEPTRQALDDAGYLVTTIPLAPAGEGCKRIDVVAACWDLLGDRGFTRSDVVVTLGGGATTDLGGFVAATWLRGVRVVHVPTTLLGMVDAAVGGKTGINTDAGKNLVGAFHEPAGVLCDLDLLRTLPAAELVSGLGEVLKCGFVADPAILDLVDADPSAALDPTSTQLRELVERAVRVKVDVVVDDLKETGGREGHPGREVLNYGHTMGHAIERSSGYAVRHGEAVAAGMVFVAELARLAGRLDDATAARHTTALASVGLPTGFAGTSYDDLAAIMRLDKKTRGAQLRFVVLDGLARPSVLAGPDEELLRASYDALVAGAA